MPWDKCSQALQEGFSILPIIERKELNRRLVRCSVDEDAQVPRWKSGKLRVEEFR